jgi:hypothetical protein
MRTLDESTAIRNSPSPHDTLRALEVEILPSAVVQVVDFHNDRNVLVAVRHLRNSVKKILVRRMSVAPNKNQGAYPLVYNAEKLGEGPFMFLKGERDK